MCTGPPAAGPLPGPLARGEGLGKRGPSQCPHALRHLGCHGATAAHRFGQSAHLHTHVYKYTVGNRFLICTCLNLAYVYIRDLLLWCKSTSSIHTLNYCCEVTVFTGKTKAIGVSNYTIKHLEELLASATVKPHVLQVCNTCCV